MSRSPDAPGAHPPRRDAVARPASVEAARPAPIIRLVDVHKSFGRHRVLQGFSLDIEPAKTTVVLGPSGCGKSVTLKHIAGLLRADRGEVWFSGERVDGLREKAWREIRLQIGFLFQMSALFDSMTVSENIEFPLREHTRFSATERARRISEALATVDLEGVEGKLPSQLSGGQRKRVALARAIVLQPRVVLYDEPTTGLDPIRSAGINELIVKLKNTLGVTGIVVTHDIVSATTVADRAVIMFDGKIAADGSMSQLRGSSDPRVRDFLTGHYSRSADELDQDNDPAPTPEVFP